MNARQLLPWALALTLLCGTQAPAREGTRWRRADARQGARTGAKEGPNSGVYRARKTASTGRLRTLRERSRPELAESASYRSLRSWRRGAAIYDRAFEGPRGSARLRAAAVEANADLGLGRFSWTDPEGERQSLNGVAGRVGARADGLRAEAASPTLALPSDLGNFEAHLGSEASASLEAQALGVASAGPEGAQLRGLASLGAFAEASLALPLAIDLAGLQTRIETRASGYAGAGVRAVLHVELDTKTGRLHFSSDLGAVVGLGAALGVTLEVDASQILARLRRAGLDLVAPPGSDPARPRAEPEPPGRAGAGGINGALEALRAP